MEINGPNVEHFFLEHPEPSEPVGHIVQAIEKFAKKNPETSFFHPKKTLIFIGKLEKMRNSSTSQHLKCSDISLKR